MPASLTLMSAPIRPRALRLWKAQAEHEAAQALRGPPPPLVHTTLVALGRQVVFEGVWTGGDDACWRFRVVRFVWGDHEQLRAFIEGWRVLARSGRFVVVESQGDGRVVRASPAWTLAGGDLEVSVPVLPRVPVTDPRRRGADLALSDDWDLVLGQGDLKLVHGVDAARQALRLLISTPLDGPLHPELGSAFGDYWAAFQHDLALLGRLFALEAARLATIPVLDEVTGEVAPVLDCLRRVECLGFDPTPPHAAGVRAHLDIEWGGGMRERVELQIHTGHAAPAS